MSNRTYSRKKRKVTACWECYRRKQKCNRARPCNICIARDIADKCVYGDAPADILKTAREDDSPLWKTFAEVDLEDVPAFDAEGVSEQIGYSPRTDINPLVKLQKSLEDGDMLSNGMGSNFLLSTMSKNRYSHLLAQLPPTPILTDLVYVYFTEANWWFLILEQYRFEEIFAIWAATNGASNSSKSLETLSPDLLYFPALLYQVIAMSLLFLPPNNMCWQALKLKSISDVASLSRRYSIYGTKVMEILGRLKPTITSIQHDLVKAVWLKNNSRGSESWHSVGSGIRQAQELGLHLDSDVTQGLEDVVEDTLVWLWDEEYKRRLWATLFIFDAHMALILGRPRAINRSDCSAKAPIDCDMPRDPSKVVPMPAHGSQAPSSYTPQIFHYQIAHIIHDMLSSGAGKPHVKDYDKVQGLHDQVSLLLDSLPPAMRPQDPDTSWDSQKSHFPKLREHIAAVSQSFVMALHRPHVAAHARSRQAAVKAALNMMNAQQRMFDLMYEHHYQIYGFSFYTITAGIFLSAIMIDRPDSQDLVHEVLAANQQAISRLALLKDRSPVAVSGEKILSQCNQRIREVLRKTPVYDDLQDFSDQVQTDRIDVLPDDWILPEPQSLVNFPMYDMFDLGSDVQDSGAVASMSDISALDFDFNGPFL